MIEKLVEQLLDERVGRRRVGDAVEVEEDAVPEARVRRAPDVLDRDVEATVEEREELRDRLCGRRAHVARDQIEREVGPRMRRA